MGSLRGQFSVFCGSDIAKSWGCQIEEVQLYFAISGFVLMQALFLSHPTNIFHLLSWSLHRPFWMICHFWFLQLTFECFCGIQINFSYFEFVATCILCTIFKLNSWFSFTAFFFTYNRQFLHILLSNTCRTWWTEESVWIWCLKLLVKNCLINSYF